MVYNTQELLGFWTLSRIPDDGQSPETNKSEYTRWLATPI
jgi:hypothetical protein